MMRILYVVSRPLEINTSASIRNRATIEGLLQLGHHVDMITTQFDKNHANFDESISEKKIDVKYLNLGGIQGNIAKIGRKYKLFKCLRRYVYKTMSKFEIYDNFKGIAKHAQNLGIS